MTDNQGIKVSKNKKNVHAALDIGNSKIACMIAQEVESNNVQIKLPNDVQIKKGVKGINSIPAVTEINVLIPGIKRPQKTSKYPYRLNHRLLLDNSSGLIPIQRPCLRNQNSRRSSLINRPKPYQGKAPNNVPNRPARTTGKKSNCPCCT